VADKVRVWCDAKADYLEVQFAAGAGHMRATEHDAVMERVNARGRVIGFSVLGVTRFRKDKPLEAELVPASTPAVVRENPAKKYGK
jgi:uncharacterized protein YdhG (YjbR/CyaY superfamily)